MEDLSREIEFYSSCQLLLSVPLLIPNFPCQMSID